MATKNIVVAQDHVRSPLSLIMLDFRILPTQGSLPVLVRRHVEELKLGRSKRVVWDDAGTRQRLC